MNDIEVKIPEFGESITEATISVWLKNEGDFVHVDEPIAELETDKVSVELNAVGTGVLSRIHHKAGEVVRVGDIAALITPDEAKEAVQPIANAPASDSQKVQKPGKAAPAKNVLPPAVSKMVAENDVDISQIQGTGRHGQISKEDVLRYLEKKSKKQEAEPPRLSSGSSKNIPQKSVTPAKAGSGSFEEKEEIVPMTRLREVIATRLVHAQQTAAILTTFNEVDMKNLMDIRAKYKDKFFEKFGVKPGFMSFFTKAAVEALKEFPAINAEIRGKEIIYKKYFHIGIAVGGPKGLVVPVIKHADQYSLAEVEKEITRLASEIKNSTLPLSSLEGGTFTISNGGVYGSMLSTPILNPPQTGILGMHNIVQRPVVVGNEIVIRPIMYLALSYDHRMVDGKEAVKFLVKIKESIEDPIRLILEV